MRRRAAAAAIDAGLVAVLEPVGAGRGAAGQIADATPALAPRSVGAGSARTRAAASAAAVDPGLVSVEHTVDAVQATTATRNARRPVTVRRDPTSVADLADVLITARPPRNRDPSTASAGAHEDRTKERRQRESRRATRCVHEQQPILETGVTHHESGGPT